jgi:predicted nuclease of predicted toxin-antitoxin system
MIILADEGVDYPVVERPRREGWSVLYVVEMAPSISDQEVLDEANARDALLLTSDKDFGELVFRLGRINSGVILLRLAGLKPDTRASVVADVLDEYADQLVNAFTVIAPGQVRIRPK